MEKPNKHYLSQVMKVNTYSDSHVESMYPWYNYMTMLFYLYGLPLTTHIHSLCVEKRKRQAQQKSNSKWMKDINVRQESIKILEEETGNNLFDLSCSNLLARHVSKVKKNKS